MDRKQRGFSIPELIVAISIMVVLLAVTIVNYREYEKEAKINSETQKMISVLKQAQMMALIGKKIGEERPTGYGIHLKEGSYALFADQNDDKRKTEVDKEIETFNLSSNLTIICSKKDIIFVFPEAEIYFDGFKETETLKIVFQMLNLPHKREIVIQPRTGKISAE